MSSRNVPDRNRGAPNTRLPRRRGRGGISSALNMGPATLVQNVQAAAQAAPSSSASTETARNASSHPITSNIPSIGSFTTSAIASPSSPKHSGRINHLQDSKSGTEGHTRTPSGSAMDIERSFSRPPLKFVARKDGPISMISMTPNSSTLHVSPIGSSPLHGAKGERKGRSASRRRSLLRNQIVADTPSRGDVGRAVLGSYSDGTATAESSMVLSPMKLPFNLLRKARADETDIDYAPGSRTAESIDPEESGEYGSSEDGESEEDDWGLVDRMRLWRHDALTQHLYETAVFWGDKILAWTHEPNDAFWLAQVFFQTGEYSRAERLLTRRFQPNPSQGSGVDADTDMHDDESILHQAESILPVSTSERAFLPGLGIHADQQTFIGHPVVTPLQAKLTASSAGFQTRPLAGFSFGMPAVGLTSTKQPNGIAHYDPFLASVPGTSNAEPFKLKLPRLMLPPPSSVKSEADPAHLGITTQEPVFESIEKEMRFSMPLLGYDDALIPIVEGEGDLEVGDELGFVRLVDISLACRYLAAQCQVRQGKWAEALEVLGEENPFREVVDGGPDIGSQDAGIKIIASMCHLRGVLYMRLNRSDRAKACFLEALALEVKCFEAFNCLVQNQMLTVDEEWELIQGLRFNEQTSEDADFIKLMYTVRLKKVKYAEEISLARQRLTEEYGLGSNCDILYTLADSLYSQLRFADCFIVTSRIMDISGIHLASVPLHVACMYHLQHLHSRLFILAHELVDKEPEAPTSWYAVGIWYLSTSKWKEAKQHLSKATIMDPRHAPGWIAFAHTFAREGEHEHAITAYSTCARLFKGTHLPHLFIGMEQLKLSHLTLASESLEAAHSMCDSDPLVFNERGVIAFLQKDYKTAVELLEKALSLIQSSQGSQPHWISTYCNLGTAYRRLGNYASAKEAYGHVLKVDPHHANALASLGMVHHMCEEYQEAIQRYHEALSIDPLHPNLLELLNMALEAGAAQPFTVPAVSDKVALATQIATEKEAIYFKLSKERDAEEKLGWDAPFGESAWTV